MRKPLMVTAVATLVAAVAVGAFQGYSTGRRDSGKQVSLCLIDALPEAKIRSPHLAEVIAGIRGRRGVCLPDRPGRPRHVPIMACSVGWGMFKEKVYSSRAILAPPDTKVSYALDIPEGGRVEFGAAAWRWLGKTAGSEEVTFEITVSSPGSETVSCFRNAVGVRADLIRDEGKDEQPGPTDRWSVDLSRWAGQRVRLTLATCLERPWTGVPPAAFWLSPILLGAGSGEGIDTVIVAVVDSMKYDDFLSIAENPRGTFGRLLTEGTFFTRAYANGTWTRTSTMSMLTSHDPLELALPLSDYAVRWGAREFFYSLPVKSLPELLREKGMESAAFGDNIFISPTSELGLDAGFDEVHFFGREGADSKAVETALKWAAARAGRPLCVYVHLKGAHRPRKPPLFSYLKLLFRHPVLFFSDPSVFASLHYDQEVLGRLVRGMEDLGRGERSLLVLTSDHGRPKKDPGRAGAKGILSEDMLRVPLLFQGKGVPPGERVSRTVNLMDVMPSILEMARMPGSGEEKGLSLAPLVRGDGDIPERDIYAIAASSERQMALIRGGEVTLLGKDRPDQVKAPKDYHIHIMDFSPSDRDLGGAVSCRDGGTITWMLPVNFGKDDNLQRLSGSRLSFNLSPGSPGRQILFHVNPEDAVCDFTVFSGDVMLDPVEIGLGPASLRPRRVPFPAVGGRRSALLSAPLYPAVLSDGTAVTIHSVPYQRWLADGEGLMPLSGPLKDLLITWGYWREAR